jgi:FlaA1/EpsC-like NDP-sugar epimerase
MLQIVPSQRASYRFQADATYVLAGGLGGLGRCMTEWMVSLGARNFLMLSRSGAASSAAQEFVDEMAAKGVNIEAPLCDITDEARVSAVVQEYKDRMPPIRGCIQATMVLKVS